MSITVRLDALLDYADHERQKWRGWLLADPSRLRIPMQPGGRFPTVADLLDHVFFVERRLLSRLEGATPPEATGIPPGDVEALFEYADLVRADFRRYVEDLNDAGADEGMVLPLSIGNVQTTRRTLATHLVLHEVRHFAQIALAARLAGHPPPGAHDILFFDAPIEPA
jgi:uncharacterized damage-inducible protein DinB